MSNEKTKSAVVNTTSRGIRLLCPGACGRHVLSFYKEGIVIHAEHFNHEKCRREKHTILIPWDRIEELNRDLLKSIEN